MRPTRRKPKAKVHPETKPTITLRDKKTGREVRLFADSPAIAEMLRREAFPGWAIDRKPTG